MKEPAKMLSPERMWRCVAIALGGLLLTTAMLKLEAIVSGGEINDGGFASRRLLVFTTALELALGLWLVIVRRDRTIQWLVTLSRIIHQTGFLRWFGAVISG